MPSAARLNDPIAPHGCWSGGTINSASGNVNINGLGAAKVGDTGTPHSWTCPGGNPPHTPAISAGSGTVNINGQPAARVGDPTDCGTTISGGSGSVNIG